ncbi:unnamed protein product [Ceutorhynchus assimilis]|uniref:Stathmin n=1 Tax=Ceutorhynchus assimilis TaxID=467358 RepID=A0A9N9MRK2_9CUCU|nr:unnamed protein product [Ceutorhynchus assimilis]
MGCNAAKNVAVVPIDGKEIGGPNDVREKISQSKKIESKNKSEPDFQIEELENANVNNFQKAEHGMSFEISFDQTDDRAGDAAQKPIPKRIIELQESENKAQVTLEDIKEKLEEAEIRRQQILNQRIQSANLLKKPRTSDIVESDIEIEQSPHHLGVPKESKPHPPNPFDVSYT